MLEVWRCRVVLRVLRTECSFEFVVIGWDFLRFWILSWGVKFGERFD